MAHGTPVEVPPLDGARKPLALAGADDVHPITDLELLHGDLLALFKTRSLVHPEFPETFKAALGPVLFEVPFVRLVHLVKACRSKPICRARTVFSRVFLHHKARTRFDDRDRHCQPVIVEDPGHAQFLAD
jgi:hypothetical protein